ncbi:MAG: hypothetical protein WD399_07635 [Thermoleophilaceae bacterium]
MRRLRWLLERPVSDHDRRRAFAVAAAVLLIAAVALSVVSDPAGRPAAGASGRPPVVRPEPPTPPAGDLPPETADVARRFLDGYLAHLYGSRRPAAIRGASDRLRRQLAAQSVRVSPAMRRQRPRVERIDGQRLADGWLVAATVAAATVAFPISVVVADRQAGPVVTRVVED